MEPEMEANTAPDRSIVGTALVIIDMVNDFVRPDAVSHHRARCWAG